ncbi:hypothetical protein [Thermococcus thioreducens]|uniref:Uncharacterized protein n=1 Tax=Thermococcus thioreducens TaxID=277988 RepID=A0A0Q2M0W7_9EURY|nr:hypothetical protein [Thermococcus thioreducens]ASJ11911.1 hypothetical protein A3L14_02970 [Thermococcus thioreducens]KQH81681.1 hypothetical protein AMR53_09800 [Thermococcus thioreducens]SEW11660.1 hypothetical protein SAMN05216170_1685 [Thermococcus thioreducens]
MAGKLAVSIAISALLSFLAWILLQLNHFLGVLLFISAVIIPPAVFRDYYSKRPLQLAPFLAASLILMFLFQPPPVSGPNIYFGLHFATGCWEKEGDIWPLSEGELSYSCNEIAAYSTVRVSGVAWKSVSVELPLLGGFVTLYEPREKADKAYREATERLELEGYIKLAENYGTYSHTIKDALFVKGNECVYLMETRVLGGGLAVISARGPCRSVKGFALRWHDDYLWNVSESPIFERYRFNWSSKEGVKIGRFIPVEWPKEWVKNTYKAIEIELKGTGYVKQMEGKIGDCRWSLWTRGEKSHYLAIKGKEILVLSGKTEDVERTAEKVSPCGMKNSRKDEGKTPEELLNLVVSALNGSFALKPAQEQNPWALAGEKLVGENLSVTLLVYGTQWQCNYARYLLDTGENTTSICIGRGGYFVTVAIEGDAKSVSVVLSSIKQPKRT